MPVIDAFETQFMQMVELDVLTGELYEQTTAELGTIQFDAITFESVLNENALQFLTFKIFKQQGFFDLYHIPLENLTTLAGEL